MLMTLILVISFDSNFSETSIYFERRFQNSIGGILTQGLNIMSI